MLAIEPNSVVMAGMAVAIIEASRAARRILSMRPRVRRTILMPFGCWYWGDAVSIVMMDAVSRESSLASGCTGAGVAGTTLRVSSSIESMLGGFRSRS